MTIAIDSSSQTVTMSVDEFNALQRVHEEIDRCHARIRALEEARLEPLPVARWHHGETDWSTRLLAQAANGQAGLLVATESMDVEAYQRGMKGCDTRQYLDVNARRRLCHALDPMITIKHRDRKDLGIMVSEASIIVGKMTK